MGACAFVSKKSEIKPSRNSPETQDKTNLILAQRYKKKVEKIETMREIFRIKDMNTPILSLKENKLYLKRISSAIKSQLNS